MNARTVNKTPEDVSPFPSASKRAETRAAKRQALLLAAVRMFNERGFHATSLDEVAASLGVTKPVIYHYLGNKDRVLLECVRIGLDQLKAAAMEARQRHGTGLDRLSHFLRRYAESCMDDFGRCVIRTNDQALSPESRKEFRTLKRETDHAMRALVAEASADGSARIDDARLTAFAFAGALSWPAHWHRPGGALSEQQVATEIVDLLIKGIKTD